ncbi:MAG: molybdenum cofactor guanylyltransferase [Acidobacteriota bacterium]
MPNEIDAYILTGGNSSRMGEAKGKLTINGKSLVERISAALAVRSKTVYTVGSVDLYPGLENICDQNGGSGERSSMNGLHSALKHASTDWIFVVACDLPFVTDDLFVHLAAARSDRFGALVPAAEDGTWQTVCALYNVSACVERCTGSIRCGDLSLRRMLMAVNALIVPFDDIHHLAGSDQLFRNINTPVDFGEARALAQNAEFDLKL